MIVTVLFFAHQRDLFGVPEKRIEVPEGSKVKDLADALARLDSRFEGLLLYTRVAVNGDWAAADTDLADGTEVAFVPPMSGG